MSYFNDGRLSIGLIEAVIRLQDPEWAMSSVQVSDLGHILSLPNGIQTSDGAMTLDKLRELAREEKDPDRVDMHDFQLNDFRVLAIKKPNP